MTRYVRLVTVGPPEDSTSGIYRNRLFDLCDGSLEESRPVGMIGDKEVWSAEALLDAIGSYAEPGRLLFVVGTYIESDVDPEPLKEEKE